jgi:NAD(P)-dependent dehydrogenase (short-subunit alcohol dehydrogenase family)
MKNFLVVAAIAVLSLFLLIPTVSAEEGANQKAVLVTGASTGIGRNLTERLVEEGYFVYAGARKDNDLAELNAIENVKAVRLDVTKQDDIDAAVELIRNEGRGLWGLVNNAGVAVTGPLHMTEHSDLHFVFSVNVSGVVSVTRAFAPMIIESQGRIATTGSIAGTLSSAGMGVYSMSKHAMEAFTDSLAADLAETGVWVCVIEPGNYKSRIRRNVVGRIAEKIEESGREVSAEEKQAFEQTAQRELSYKEPDEVSDAFMHALFSDEPKRRYMVVPNEQEAGRTIGKHIQELVQLNDWQAYSYTRDELVQMLDEALGNR